MSETKKKYVMAIDSGGSSIRAILFNHDGEIVGEVQKKTPPSFPEEGAIEHDPEVLWQALLKVVQELISKQNVSPEEIASIGITNQRGSFCLIDKATGKPLTNLISWADVRSHECAARMDKKASGLRFLGKTVGNLINNTMLMTTGMLHLNTEFALVRLKWLYEQEKVIYHDSTISGKELFNRSKKGEILFCTLDTWFIYKLTGHKSHYTDMTNASGTAIYNPFDKKWNPIYMNMFKIPKQILPKVLDTNGKFGYTEKSLFGAEIQIGSSVGDQMAALFGHCCFTPGETKISQGSGAFVDMCIGPKPKLSKRGLFPLIAWTLNGQTTYMLEGQVTTCGTLIDWLGEGIGVSDTPKALNEFASQTDDTEGVIVIPTANGINFPYFNPKTRATIFGLSLKTHRKHVARAVLEGLALRLYDVLRGIEHDTKVKLIDLKVDGGVSKSDIELQCLADFANIKVQRAPLSEMTGLGAAYLAGLSVGFWKDQDELRTLKQNYIDFTPKMDPKKREKKLLDWNKAVKSLLSLNI